MMTVVWFRKFCWCDRWRQIHV